MINIIKLYVKNTPNCVEVIYVDLNSYNRVMDEQKPKYDVVIVGGGAAGLAAANVLARARRRVIVVDSGDQNNQSSRAAHSVFGHDGKAPADLYAVAREDLLQYGFAQIVSDTVISINRSDSLFDVGLLASGDFEARMVLLAQGVSLNLPNIPGLTELWGAKVWHCPFCDGFEHSDKKLLVICDRAAMKHTATILPTWSRDLHWLCTDGSVDSDTEQMILASGGLFTPDVGSVHDKGDGVLVKFADGSSDTFDAVVAGPALSPRDNLADKLGCERTSENCVWRDDNGRTSVYGVYVAGDQTDIVQQVNVAVASGHKAAAKIVEELAMSDREEDLQAYDDRGSKK